VQQPGQFNPPRFPFFAGRRRNLMLSSPRANRDLLTLDEEGVIGEDDRSLSPNNIFPFTSVVRLVYEANGNAKAQCTAAFIDKNVLITAASCLYNDDERFFYDFDLIKLYDNHKKQLDAIVNTAVITTSFTLGDTSSAVAVVILESNKDLLGTYGALGLGSGTCSIQSAPSLLLGYPGTIVWCIAQGMLLRESGASYRLSWVCCSSRLTFCHMFLCCLQSPSAIIACTSPAAPSSRTSAHQRSLRTRVT
jgi:hypothetical protein